ncbi:7137_t:CDS:2, partial [Acaulospora colombiana]
VITTATHGTGISFKILGDDVLSLSLLLADCTLVYCSRYENSDLFKATLCGLGSTGLVVSVQIRVEPAFRLRETQETREFEDVMENLDEIVQKAQHVRLWWYPQNKTVRVCSADRTTEFAQHTTEWAIPYEYTKECLVHLNKWLEEEPYSTNGTYPNFPIELRFSAPDDIWLSPAYGRRTCWIGIIQFKYPHPMPHLRHNAVAGGSENAPLPILMCPTRSNLCSVVI